MSIFCFTYLSIHLLLVYVQTRDWTCNQGYQENALINWANWPGIKRSTLFILFYVYFIFIVFYFLFLKYYIYLLPSPLIDLPPGSTNPCQMPSSCPLLTVYCKNSTWDVVCSMEWSTVQLSPPCSNALLLWIVLRSYGLLGIDTGDFMLT